MGETTAISWTDSTFNPWIGCQRVSPGCVNCYAEALDHRWRPGRERWGPTAERTRTSDENWRKPLAWNGIAEKHGKRRRVFCSSLADVFEDRAELVPWRAQLFELILQTPWLDWQLLTKRPENIRSLWPKNLNGPGPLFWPNVWLGTTVEDRTRMPRAETLAEIPAVVHFLSCEPMLEDLSDLPLAGIEWVICGGESGPGARVFEVHAAKELLKHCDRHDVAFFMKQVGDNPMSGRGAHREAYPAKAHHGADPSEWPELLRRQQFPRAA